MTSNRNLYNTAAVNQIRCGGVVVYVFPYHAGHRNLKYSKN